VGKIAKKNSLKECSFVNSALKIQCHIVKSTILQTAFWEILPTGIAKYNCYCTRHKIISMLSRDGYSTFYSVITIFF